MSLPLDPTAARRAPGVLAVFTGADVAGLGTMRMTLRRRRPDGSAMFAPPHPGLVRDRVRYVGDPVAVVVARPRAEAEDAADRVRVAYEPLPSVTSTAGAIGGAPVWDECPDNVSNVFEAGDRAATDAAFARADRIVRRRYVEQVVYDPESGQLLTASFMDYALPRADTLPDLRVESNPVPTRLNPLGAKGAGEAGTVGALPAVMNAVIDALAPLGAGPLDMPATPARVWRAIRDATAAREGTR